MRWNPFIFALVMLEASSGIAGTSADPDKYGRATTSRTDVLYLASELQPLSTQNLLDNRSGKERSIPMAFGLSAAVPGLGQVYNGSWWKAGIAVAVEAALITAYVSWKSTGNDGVDEYEAYAHQKWNPARYASWLNAYSGYAGPDIELPPLEDADYMHPESWTSEQRAQVDALINDIRAAERQSIYLRTGAGFSHVLPFFGEQQYYELIGKYFQYAPGWVDYSYDADVDPESVMPDDAEFYYYSGIHADANDYLRKASWAGAFVILNHFAAGIEAAVSAKLHNMSLRPKASMTLGPLGDPMATGGVVVDF